MQFPLYTGKWEYVKKMDICQNTKIHTLFSESILSYCTRNVSILNYIPCFFPFHRQVVILLSQLEGSGGYSISHRLLHRMFHRGVGLGDWGTTVGEHHIPALEEEIKGLHMPRPL